MSSIHTHTHTHTYTHAVNNPTCLRRDVLFSHRIYAFYSYYLFILLHKLLDLQSPGIPLENMYRICSGCGLPTIVGMEEKLIGKSILPGNLGEESCWRRVRGREWWTPGNRLHNRDFHSRSLAGAGCHWYYSEMVPFILSSRLPHLWTVSTASWHCKKVIFIDPFYSPWRRAPRPNPCLSSDPLLL